MENVATLINGNLIDSIPVTDRGLQYGDGIFETMAVVDSNIPLWPYHYQRLQTGCDRLGIEIPELMGLQTELLQLMQGMPKALIKLIVTRGEGRRGYAPMQASLPSRILQRYTWPDMKQENKRLGVHVRRCQLTLAHQPLLAGIKHLNRLEQILARGEWDDDSIHEGLIGDINGHVIEATAHNVFIIEAGRLFTPGLEYCGVAGVMRQWILDNAPEWNIPAEIANITWERLQQADEVFICNSIHGVWPVRKFESKSYSVGPVSGKINQAFVSWMQQS